MDKEYHRDIRQKLRHDATFPERLLWTKIRRKQTGFKFRRQHSIGPFVVDFCCVETLIVVEVDGEYHSIREVVPYDERREKYLEEGGYKVLRYDAAEVMNNLEGVVTDIRINCERMKK